MRRRPLRRLRRSAPSTAAAPRPPPPPGQGRWQAPPWPPRCARPPVPGAILRRRTAGGFATSGAFGLAGAAPTLEVLTRAIGVSERLTEAAVLDLRARKGERLL